MNTLIWAVYSSHLDLAEHLAATYGLKWDAEDRYGRTVVHFAVITGLAVADLRAMVERWVGGCVRWGR